LLVFRSGYGVGHHLAEQRENEETGLDFGEATILLQSVLAVLNPLGANLWPSANLANLNWKSQLSKSPLCLIAIFSLKILRRLRILPCQIWLVT